MGSIWQGNRKKMHWKARICGLLTPDLPTVPDAEHGYRSTVNMRDLNHVIAPDRCITVVLECLIYPPQLGLSPFQLVYDLHIFLFWTESDSEVYVFFVSGS